jgi:hypothetical protein
MPRLYGVMRCMFSKAYSTLLQISASNSRAASSSARRTLTLLRREAREIRRQHEINGQPPNAETVRGLRQWWEVLIHNVRVLRAEDEQ